MDSARVDLTESELREGLTACLAVPRWVEDVAGHAPYASLDELIEVARAAATPLRPEEIDRALAHHPRIGEKAAGEGRSQAFSRSEQATSATTDDALTTRLGAGNRAYEERFGRVFLIRAAGRTRPEIVAELERRLTLPHEQEIDEVGAALRDIALLRIPQLFAHLDQHSGYDESEAAR